MVKKYNDSKPLDKDGDKTQTSGTGSRTIPNNLNDECYLDIREKWIKIVHFDMLKKNTLYNQKEQKQSFK